MPFFVYILKDPRSLDVRYVGQTNSLKRRLQQHICKANKNDRPTQSSCWIKSLINLGTAPLMEVLKEFQSSEECSAFEIEMISLFKAKGCRLTNATDGGEGQWGMVHSEKTKTKIREKVASSAMARRGIKRSSEIRGRISEAKKGKALSEDHKRKLSKAKAGKALSKEHRASIACALRGRKQTQAHIDKVIKSKQLKRELLCMHSPQPQPKKKRGGLQMSEEVRVSMSEARKGAGNPMFGKTLSDSAKAHLSKVTTGIKRSEKFKENCRKAWELRRLNKTP